MKLTEALTQRKALKENIGQFKLRLPTAARVPAGDTPTERPQESMAALEVELQELQALIAQSNQANLQATLPDGRTLMQVMAQYDHPDLQQGILAAWVISALPAQGAYTDAANARPDGGCHETTSRDRPAIHCLLETGRHYLEGGLRHVPAIAGSAHSQAPPIPLADDAGNRSQYT
jgi:hypothetical protein